MPWPPAFLALLYLFCSYINATHPVQVNSELPPLGGVQAWPPDGAGLPLATGTLQALLTPFPVMSSGWARKEERVHAKLVSRFLPSSS